MDRIGTTVLSSGIDQSANITSFYLVMTTFKTTANKVLWLRSLVLNVLICFKITIFTLGL